jgi:tRNA1Val (adenine37-N6)-methyltransferase
MNPRRNLEAFRFKEFVIEHQNSTLAVGTDALLLAAFTNLESTTKNVLDVGTGCGVITLALAQKANSATNFLAIDIDEPSVKEAKLNFLNSKWKAQLSAQVTGFENLQSELFDVIVCNPPFFRDALKNDLEYKKNARHQDNFDLNEFAFFCFNSLVADGKTTLVYPYSDLEYLEKCFDSKGFYTNKITTVYPKKSKAASRVLIEFTKLNSGKKKEVELVIYEENNQYTADYKLFTKDFYLRF